MTSTLASSFNQYQAALQALESGDDLSSKEALAILCTRDALQLALAEKPEVMAAQLQQIHSLDDYLRAHSQKIVKALELAAYRQSYPAPATSWWWRLDQAQPPHWLDRFDWLANGMTLGGWTMSLALLFNIAGRFFSGGPDLVGAAAVIFSSLLALLKAKSDLTEKGRDRMAPVLKALKIPTTLHAEAKLGSTLVFLLGLLLFWQSLPRISNVYNRQGVEQYHAGQLDIAEARFLRAIALAPDNLKARYNLGLVYEDWLKFEAAKQAYQAAAIGHVPSAFNNLARLYIQEENYDDAVSLLTKALEQTKAETVYPEDRYNFYKNLGWARFGQGRDEEAEAALTTANAIAAQPIELPDQTEGRVSDYLKNRASAHCLLAQVLERRRQAEALEHWQACYEQVNPLVKEEDAWLHLARQRLNLPQTLPNHSP